MMRMLCGICCDKGDYTRTAMPATVKSGELTIRTQLCTECLAKAEDGKEANPWLQKFDGPPIDVPIPEALNRGGDA